MRANYAVITFDCYGTLIDWERGIGDAFQAAAKAAGIEVETERVLGIYHEVESEVQAAAFRPYRAVLAETAQRVAEYVGWVMDAVRPMSVVPGGPWTWGWAVSPNGQQVAWIEWTPRHLCGGPRLVIARYLLY